MSHTPIPAGFRQIQRHGAFFQERVHDAYKAKGKLPDNRLPAMRRSLS